MTSLVEVFQDTQKRIGRHILLASRTKAAMEKTTIYDEGFVSGRMPHRVETEYTVLESTTLLAASAQAVKGKRIAVLNFANPVEPGGGVLRGAKAQEEYLCRASNLYNCLTGKNAGEWYAHHRRQMEQSEDSDMFLATDRILYSPDVTVIRKDLNYRPRRKEFVQEYTKEWQRVDVITAAAPYFRHEAEARAMAGLEELFIRRIRNILETAIENRVDILILGAFGCGAFHNPPYLVAHAFAQVFRQERYQYAFEKVCFAILRTEKFCKNIHSFQCEFLEFPNSIIWSPEYIYAHDPDCMDLA